jgi:hypothetical protein
VSEPDAGHGARCAGALPDSPHAVDLRHAHTVVARLGRPRAVVCSGDCLARYLQGASVDAERDGMSPLQEGA